MRVIIPKPAPGVTPVLRRPAVVPVDGAESRRLLDAALAERYGEAEAAEVTCRDADRFAAHTARQLARQGDAGCVRAIDAALSAAHAAPGVRVRVMHSVARLAATSAWKARRGHAAAPLAYTLAGMDAALCGRPQASAQWFALARPAGAAR